MEVAMIDWKRLDSRFVKDELFEHINAPQWVDLRAPDPPADDDSWFCRPGCHHPKTYEDFLKQTPPIPKERSGLPTEIQPLGDRSKREAALKKRGPAQPPNSLNKEFRCDGFVEDCENRNPNYSTPPPINKASKSIKETIKSSAEKQASSQLRKEERTTLKSTLSAKNLFAGRDILSQVTEFCNELKKLATRARDRGNPEKTLVENENREGMARANDCSSDLGENKRKPFMEMNQHTTPKNVRKCNMPKADAENITPISVDMKRIKKTGCQNPMQIRTCPPSPQCFSGPGQPSKPTHLGRGILQELERSNEETKEGSADRGGSHRRHNSTITESEARGLDLFWFLKPCTLSS